MHKIVAVDAKGGRKTIKAEYLEIELAGGRRLVLDFPPEAWGDLSIEAQDDAGVPVLSLQPGACNLLTLRVDTLHGLADDEDDAVASVTATEPPVLELALQKALDDADKRLPRPKKAQVRNWAQAALTRDAVVTVRLVGEAEGRELNRLYRGKDYATNVLTFVYDEGGEGEPEAATDGALHGDLVLCVPVVAREAAEQGKPAEAHYAHLVVHGMLHLQGFDHEADAEAEIMEARERAVLARLGYADPYAERGDAAGTE